MIFSRMMQLLIHLLQLMFFRDIICSHVVSRDIDLRANEEQASKTSIVSYRRERMTTQQIETENGEETVDRYFSF